MHAGAWCVAHPGTECQQSHPHLGNRTRAPLLTINGNDPVATRPLGRITGLRSFKPSAAFSMQRSPTLVGKRAGRIRTHRGTPFPPGIPSFEGPRGQSDRGERANKRLIHPASHAPPRCVGRTLLAWRARHKLGWPATLVQEATITLTMQPGLLALAHCRPPTLSRSPGESMRFAMYRHVAAAGPPAPQVGETPNVLGGRMATGYLKGARFIVCVTG
jgi:hypothetical protein